MIVMIFVLGTLLFYTNNPYFFTTFSKFLSLLFPYFLLKGTWKPGATAHVILKVCEENAVNDVLFAPLSNYREGASKLRGISNKTISRIKADSENAVLAPLKPWRDKMEVSDFDKCEICINCKIIHNKQDYI